MRTYQSKEKTNKKMSKRTLVTLLSSCAVLVLAFAIALPILLSRAPSNPIEEPVPTIKPISFVMPVGSYTMGGEFKIDELVYSATLNQWRTHSGVDLLAAAGSDVKAIADGKVTDVKSTTLEGYVVTITHKDGYVSIYKSLGEATVAVGTDLLAGEKIGTVSITMITEQAEGAHLHLEMTKNGSPVNPLDYIPYQGDK